MFELLINATTTIPVATSQSLTELIQSLVSNMGSFLTTLATLASLPGIAGIFLHFKRSKEFASTAEFVGMLGQTAVSNAAQIKKVADIALAVLPGQTAETLAKTQPIIEEINQKVIDLNNEIAKISPSLHPATRSAMRHI